MKLMIFLLFASSAIYSKTIFLKDFNYPLSDISKIGISKERLFEEMKFRLVRPHDSICSNRAHVWAYDFKKSFNVESAKIFLFYTAKTGRQENVNWWYHVTPVINEKGRLWAMDAGDSGRITTPLLYSDWLKKWNGKKSVCREIKSTEDDLVELIFNASAFPEVTRYGRYDCYYKIVPAGFWTPRQLASHLLGKDSKGRPVNINRDEFREEEVIKACLETATNPIGWFFETKLAACRYFVYRGEY